MPKQKLHETYSEAKWFLSKATLKILPISVSVYHATFKNSSGFSLNVLLVPSMSVLSFLHHNSFQILKFLILLPRYRKNSRCPVRCGQIETVLMVVTGNVFPVWFPNQWKFELFQKFKGVCSGTKSVKEENWSLGSVQLICFSAMPFWMPNS